MQVSTNICKNLYYSKTFLQFYLLHKIIFIVSLPSLKNGIQHSVVKVLHTGDQCRQSETWQPCMVMVCNPFKTQAVTVLVLSNHHSHLKACDAHSLSKMCYIFNLYSDTLQPAVQWALLVHYSAAGAENFLTDTEHNNSCDQVCLSVCRSVVMYSSNLMLTEQFAVDISPMNTLCLHDAQRLQSPQGPSMTRNCSSFIVHWPGEKMKPLHQTTNTSSDIQTILGQFYFCAEYSNI